MSKVDVMFSKNRDFLRVITRKRALVLKFSSIVIAAALLLGAMVWLGRQKDSTQMPVGDLPGWRQTQAQDFNVPAAFGEVGKVYGRDMRGYADFHDSSGNGIYSPDAVLSVADGKLDYYLHTEGGAARVASVIPFGYQGQKYGRYSVRFRADPLPGFKIAFMLWPTSDRWSDGEIDWPEGNLDGNAYAASAIVGSLEQGGMKFDPPNRVEAPTDMSEWHIATTEWTPRAVKWYWDGKLVGETTSRPGVPYRNMRWTLQAETADEASISIPAAMVSGHLQIDWIVQYAYDPTN